VTKDQGQAAHIHWPRFAELIRGHRRFLLTSHVRPDCDALGSELGMAGVLAALGKEVRIVNPHPTPPHLAFIDERKQIQQIGRDVTKESLGEYDALMVLDTSAWAQLGDMGDVIRTTRAKKIVLDHHVSADDLGAEEFKDVEAEATGRLVLEAAEHLGVKLTPEIATPLFAAVATDTGWFRFSSTTAGTFEVGAKLVAAGAKPDVIFQSLYERDTLARLQLRGRIIARATTELGGRLIHTVALKEDFEATGALPVDTEDVINLTLGVANTEVAVILVQQAAGGFKISFRSRGQLDCAAIAQTFGGGGHKAAAGAYIEGPFAAAQAKVLDAVRKAMG
jgi:phosphoesterase RecJ-like protein